MSPWYPREYVLDPFARQNELTESVLLRFLFQRVGKYTLRRSLESVFGAYIWCDIRWCLSLVTVFQFEFHRQLCQGFKNECDMSFSSRTWNNYFVAMLFYSQPFILAISANKNQISDFYLCCSFACKSGLAGSYLSNYFWSRITQVVSLFTPYFICSKTRFLEQLRSSAVYPNVPVTF